MRYFPIFIDLAGARVVVIGGGEEALRKVRLLLKTDARIDVVAPALHAELAAEPRVTWLAKTYDATLLDGATLVYSADSALNAQVSADARARRIHVNAVDQADISTFIVPSIVDRDPVVVAIGTEGAAPVLAQGIRAKIDALLPQALGALARKARGLRDVVAGEVPQGRQRRAFWREFFFGAPRDAFVAGDEVAFDLAFHDAMYLAGQASAGRLNVVSANIADPELLTLKAQRHLQEADVIVHGRMVPPTILELARRDAVRIAAHGAAADAAITKAIAEGLNVVKLEAGAEVVPFPVREDIRDFALRAVS